MLDEMRRVVGDKAIDYEVIKDLDYLEGIIKEVLRLRPPIIIIWRKVMKAFSYKST